MLNIFNIKKRYFERELKATQGQIWSLEFAIFGIRENREKIRKHYDNAVNAMNMLAANPNSKQEEKEKVELEVVNLKNLMMQYDAMLEGTAATTEAEGTRGLNDQLAGQIQKRDNLQKFIKLYC